MSELQYELVGLRYWQLQARPHEDPYGRQGLPRLRDADYVGGPFWLRFTSTARNRHSNVNLDVNMNASRSIL